MVVKAFIQEAKTGIMSETKYSRDGASSLSNTAYCVRCWLWILCISCVTVASYLDPFVLVLINYKMERKNSHLLRLTKD